MNWDLVFTITNNYALVMWLILAFAPRRTVIMTGLFYGGTGLLATSYAVIVVPLMTGMIDGGSGGIPDFSTLAGVQQLLSSPGGATIGWIHYLAFDLFVGLWVARNADKYGFARWLQIPILLFVLMLGPLGLVLYLLLRFTRHNKVADAVIPE
ncbi:ABA4-like family protein [uncultured Parasphingorhabdus sp.]|uniref:ABA4-like family protein n=1 Tax=uncultured Parasphingorhabdus sp. TaxID=2709694 RepID=UPI0030DAC82C|tara:strand:+ start:112170 stop:112628 length:459 start_codon:yes stop_codon:yes gene_type:complete